MASLALFAVALTLKMWAVLAQRLVYVYVGFTNETQTPTKVYLYPDIILRDIIISSNDFSCIEILGCSKSGQPQTMTFLNKTFQYVQATAQINFIKQPFAERVQFKYVFNDTQNVISMLGIGQNSTFLNYYNKQNRKNDYSLAFELDFENMMIFIDPFVDNNGIHPYGSLNAQFSYNFTDRGLLELKSDKESLPLNAKLCFSNRVDMNPRDINVMAVKEGTVAAWTSMINRIILELDTPNKILSNNITLSLYDSNNQFVGDMVYYLDEFLSEDKNLLIRGFTDEFDEGRGCEIYTGMKMLKKYDFKYFYIENSAGYSTFFSYDLSNMPTNLIVSGAKGFWWKLILFLVIIAIIGYFTYRYLTLADDSHETDDGVYRGFKPGPEDLTELKEHAHKAPPIKKINNEY
jgi:hypothetical protein